MPTARLPCGQPHICHWEGHLPGQRGLAPAPTVALRDTCVPRQAVGAEQWPGAAGEAAHGPCLCFPSRLKRGQDPVSQPLPAPEAGRVDGEDTADGEEARPSLPMCGPLCPSAGSG